MLNIDVCTLYRKVYKNLRLVQDVTAWQPHCNLTFYKCTKIDTLYYREILYIEPHKITSPRVS